ncbi:hypothetical protein [Natrinema sp. 74]|uniref:hypothetical protein n=1 Tax=Natrinema sp. 74 TaxID=3384159 RepID=UPI0038D3DFBC
MGIAVLLIGCFLKSDWSESTVADSHQAIQKSQFKSAPEKATDVVECQKPGKYSDATKHVPLDEFTRELNEIGENEIFYRRESDKIDVTYRTGPDIGDLSMPVGFGGLNGWQFDPDEVGVAAVDSRIDALVEMFRYVATAIDPDVAFLTLFNDHGTGDAMLDSHEPSRHGLEALPFLLLLSEPWIDYCGGREHVVKTPVYDVSELETGSLLLRVKQRPSVDGCRYTQGFDHLFGER